MISPELLSEVLGKEVFWVEVLEVRSKYLRAHFDKERYLSDSEDINIHELAHSKVKEWAKINHVFDKIEWAEEPAQIFKKAEELRNEIN